jgi:hypothetical protein
MSDIIAMLGSLLIDRFEEPWQYVAKLFGKTRQIFGRSCAVVR